MNDIGFYVNIATLIAIVGGIIKLTLGVSGAKAELDKSIDQSEAELRVEASSLERRLQDLIDRNERESLDRAEALRQMAGELGNALRTKIHECETWNRDTFVRRDSFELVIGRLEKSIEKIGDKIDDKFAELTKVAGKSSH